MLWRTHMATIGQNIIDHRVRRIVLVHGTFVGQDPLDMIHLLQKVFRSQSRTLTRLQSSFKNRGDRLVQDSGNFTDDYVELLSGGLGGELPVDKFCWSSANHHVARLRGAIDLLQHLVRLDIHSGERVLVIGHSHAGQLFALLTQMINDVGRRDRFLSILGIDPKTLPVLTKALGSLSSTGIDFVTLGAPVRYQWVLRDKHRLLHIVNHRGDTPLGGAGKGVLTTRDGDYVQQWGVEGSDSIPTTAADYQANRKLAGYLGCGFDLTHWQRMLRRRVRVAPVGRVILTDYRDHGGSLNCFATLFGHGAYTRYENMLFLMHRIDCHLYRESAKPCGS